MKFGAVVLIIVLSITSINYAVADRRHGHNYNRGHGHYKNYYRGRGHGHYSYGPRRNYGSRGYYGYYDRGGDYWAYALGGLVVGGVLGATLANSYNEPRYSTYSERVYVYPNPASNAVQPSYVLQPNGICYVVNAGNNGNLVLSPVSPGNCQ